MDGWKTFSGLFLGFRPIFRCELLVSGRVGSLNWLALSVDGSEILHQLIGSLSDYSQGLYIPHAFQRILGFATGHTSYFDNWRLCWWGPTSAGNQLASVSIHELFRNCNASFQEHRSEFHGVAFYNASNLGAHVLALSMDHLWAGCTWKLVAQQSVMCI